MPAFQAGHEGSIPFARFNQKPQVAKVPLPSRAGIKTRGRPNLPGQHS
jgi:hypothetical protein